jgi:hypothetical protein
VLVSAGNLDEEWDFETNDVDDGQNEPAEFFRPAMIPQAMPDGHLDAAYWRQDSAMRDQVLQNEALHV